MFSFGYRRRSSHRGLFGGGILGTLLLSLAPYLYRYFMKKRNAGQFGLREAYPAGSEWNVNPQTQSQAV